MLTDEYMELVNKFNKISGDMINEIFEQNRADIMKDRAVNFITARYDIYAKYSEKINKVLMSIKLTN